jgi:hypothetical protein
MQPNMQTSKRDPSAPFQRNGFRATTGTLVILSALVTVGVVRTVTLERRRSEPVPRYYQVPDPYGVPLETLA